MRLVVALVLALPSTLLAQQAGRAVAMQQGTAAPAPLYAFGFAPGEQAVNVRFTDVDGRPGTLGALAGRTGTVLVIRDAECPVSQRYGPRLAAMEKEYGARGFAFAYVDITPAGAAEIKADVAKYGLTGRVIPDGNKVLRHALRASSTGEAFVLDARRTIRYRGAIDDQFGVGFHKDAATRHHLRNALDAVAAGRAPEVKETAVSGCLTGIDRETAGTARPVTYHNRVSRIVQEKCQSCHRAGGLAPMPLETHQQVAERRAMIELMVTSGRMPPWSAHRKVGEWANDASLSDRDMADLLRWIKAGAPAGSVADAPAPRKWPKGWSIEPTAVVQIPDTFRVPKQGVVQYKYSYIKTNFDEDKWVTAVEIRPSAPKVVHHVIVFLEEPGRKERTDPTWKQGDPLPQGGIDGFFAATAPGTQATVYPAGSAKRLPKGAWLKVQLHYTPNGVEHVDQTKIAFTFADQPVQHEVMTRSAFNTRFVIPPYAKRHQVNAAITLRQPVRLLNLFPHMHARGAAFRMEVVLPDSTRTVLLDVPRYDFNWQTYYAFKDQPELPAGSRILATAWYDNTKDNPFNPNPADTVRFGEQTFEEMMIGYFDYIVLEPAKAAVAPAPATPVGGPRKDR